MFYVKSRDVIGMVEGASHKDDALRLTRQLECSVLEAFFFIVSSTL